MSDLLESEMLIDSGKKLPLSMGDFFCIPSIIDTCKYMIAIEYGLNIFYDEQKHVNESLQSSMSI